MISKLLIANRSEIALRVIATCQRLGIKTVAVFSDADREALHVLEADEAIHIGPSAPTESYLNVDALLQAARRTGADAIHPGYGFLAENAEFCRRVTEAGLTFVGPRAEVIEQMGSKVAARKCCQQAGVPTVPGSSALDDAGLLAWADETGFPLMLKASAGGGGKGMRQVDDRRSLQDAIPSARREALKAFADDSLYLEKAIVEGRHLEVQILADQHGHCVHLGIRDCSLQRRHQKLIEETPPANLSLDVSESLCRAAVQLARSVDYTNAGTVEFLVEGENIYFLEMNTRLQVEHPVTEMVYDVDLVELQILVAEGARLPFSQEELVMDGHAIEARLGCEDPQHNFAPAVGRVLRWEAPDSVRVDSGLIEGQEISPHYDSMVAKVVAWAPQRKEALRRLGRALDSTVLLGVKSNARFLSDLLTERAFQEAAHHTQFLSNYEYSVPEARAEEIVSAAYVRYLELCGFRPQKGALACELSFEGYEPVWLQPGRCRFQGSSFQVSVSDGTVEVEGHRFPCVVRSEGDEWWIHSPWGTRTFRAQARFPSKSDGQEVEGSLSAPMPGSVVEVLVKPGETVSQGQTLIKLEAMKMEQLVSAPRDGKIEELYFSVGDQVEAGAELLRLVQTAEQP